MYAPSIYSDVTVTVTGEVASDLIKRARLGEHREDCWLLRDGTTTIVAKQALTDALVVIAEEPVDEAPQPSARPETPADQRTSHEARTSANGKSPLRDFLLTALDHDAIMDEVIELLSEHVEIQRRSPVAIADDLRSIIYRAVGEASVEDWRWVTDALIAEACETLGIEHPLDRTPPGADTPHRPTTGTRASRNLDPDELREKLATIYARDTASHSARRATRWIVRHISRLTGLSREQIEAEGRTDADTIDELVHVAGDDRVSPEDRGSTQTAAPTSGSAWPLRRISRLEAAALLQKGEQSTDPVTRTRCAVILAANAGVSPARLAATHLMSVADITRIISEFNEHGISSVERSQ